MKIHYLLPSFVLMGCAHAQPPSDDPTPLPDFATPGASAVQLAGAVKAYPVGRYPDPNNPFVLHEGHTIYREEATPTWNLAPHTSITFGPDVADPNPSHVTTTADLEQKVREQNDLMRVTTEQNDRLIAEIKWLQAHQAVLPVPPVPPVTNAVPPAPEDPPKNKTNPSTEPAPKFSLWSWLWSFIPTPTKK